MKLFEYMASGTPMVVSAIPSIQEVVDENLVFFAKPDQPVSFAEAITYILLHMDEAHGRAQRAQERVRIYTWKSRAEKILAMIQAHLSS